MTDQENATSDNANPVCEFEVTPTIIAPPAGQLDSPCEFVRRPRLPVNVRWMIRRDMPEVMAIEGNSFEFPWSEKEFLNLISTKNCIGMVAESTATDSLNQVVGYMVYELHKHSIQLANLAVAPNFHRRGVGTALLAKLRAKLSPLRRRKLQVDVRESNLNCHLWLRACGMRACSVLRRHFEETDESAYRFVCYSNGDEGCRGS